MVIYQALIILVVACLVILALAWFVLNTVPSSRLDRWDLRTHVYPTVQYFEQLFEALKHAQEAFFADNGRWAEPLELMVEAPASCSPRTSTRTTSRRPSSSPATGAACALSRAFATAITSRRRSS
jgi:hypothetical protein